MSQKPETTPSVSSENTPPKPTVTKPMAPKPTREHLDELLDEALDESFPASDPEAIAVDRQR